MRGAECGVRGAECGVRSAECRVRNWDRREGTLRRMVIPALLACWWLGAPDVARAQSVENVAVIINESVPGSLRVGEYYVQRRGIPASNVIRIKTTTEETIERAAYVRTIEEPIAAALAGDQLQDRILYLVLTKGVPLRIAGTRGQEGTGASVDSELTLLYRRMVGQTVLTRGRVDNPYYLGARDLREARPFTHRDHDIFLVSRLDGFTIDQTLVLVDNARTAVTDGRIVLDQRGAVASKVGDDWLFAAASRLSAAGHVDRVLIESSAKPARDVAPVLGYYSWGSTDPENRVRSVGMSFAPGAIAATFGSADARTFHEPPAGWVPSGDVVNRATWFEGSAHSLVGDLIREGVTGVAGHISEPYLQSVVRPDVLFSAYLAGHNLIESYYLALPHVSWQAVIIGDPLSAPFPRKDADRADLEPQVDPQTDLPAFFSARRIRQVSASAPGMPQGAVASWVRATTLRSRGNIAEAQRALEQSVELAPGFVGARLELGMLHEQNGATEAAVEQYRRILELQPRHVVALNNLAYSLAVRRDTPAEALPLARRAATLAPTLGSVLDTLGWIEHLLGDNMTAAKRLAEAIQRSPSHPDIRLHAAIVYAAIGDRARAETELKEALRLNPSLLETEEVRQLSARLATLQR